MYNGVVVDAFVQHQWANQDELAAYLPKEWQAYLKPHPEFTMPVFPFRRPYSNPAGNYLPGLDQSESRPGSSLDVLQEHVLTSQVGAVVLSHDEGMNISLMANKRLQRELARAANDWCVEQWLE